jgi:hypothetical protein
MKFRAAMGWDLNVRHCHEKLREKHQIGLSYTCVNRALHPTDQDLSPTFSDNAPVARRIKGSPNIEKRGEA